MHVIEFEDFIKFEYKNSYFNFYFLDIINYVNEYYRPYDNITDIDGLLQLIIDYADNGDIFELISLFKSIDYDISDYDFIIIGRGLSIWRFNDLYDLGCIYNLEDIVAHVIEHNQIYNYCIEL